MRTPADRVANVIDKLESGWNAFNDAYAGLSDTELEQSGTVGEWSIKDLIAHISSWENEALEHLPTVAAGGRPPKYAAAGGIDAFNDRQITAMRSRSLADVLDQAEKTHARLIAYLRTVPDEFLAGESRFRRRLRLDTYGHYPLHTQSIREWRERQ